jgi:putative Mg2+ transporter-C (MgtC) family protein
MRNVFSSGGTTVGTMSGAEDPLGSLFWARVGVTVLCAGLIGLERQLRGKPAGIRTTILVCLGTMLFVRLGVDVQADGADPTRVLGQVVTGIGFLGGGLMLARDGHVKGVTSAAVIWIVAGIGATIGLDQFRAAGALTLVTLVVLVGVQKLEHAFRALRRGVHGPDPSLAEASTAALETPASRAPSGTGESDPE